MRRIKLIGLGAGALFAMSVASAGSVQAAALPTMSLTIKGPSITVSGVPQSGAVNVIASASGEKQAGAILFLLRPGVGYAEFEAFLASKKSAGDPNNTGPYGSIVFNLETTPGKNGEAQTYLQPGQYVAVETAGEGPPKAHASFTVAPAASPIALPKPEARLRSIDFAFRGPTSLHDGELVGFENEGFLVHMDVALRVKNMKVAREVVVALLEGDERAAGKLAIGGVAFQGPVSTGAYQQETITAKPGIYVQACFMPTEDGRSHSALGMERIIKITR